MPLRVHNLSTIDGLNQAAAEVGNGFLPNDLWGFPVRYGCLLWQVYLGRYREGPDGLVWDMDPDVQRIGAITVPDALSAAHLLDVQDADPVPGSWSSSRPVPQKVFWWSIAAEIEAMKVLCACRLPELRRQLLQRAELNRRTYPDERWPNWPWSHRPEGDWLPEAIRQAQADDQADQQRAREYAQAQLPAAPRRPPKPGHVFCVLPRGKRVSVPEGARCRVCKQVIWAGETVEKWDDGFRHVKCEPKLVQVCQNGRHISVSAPWNNTKCGVCHTSLNRPRGGEVYRHGQDGFRHARCNIHVRCGEQDRKPLPINTPCLVCHEAVKDGDRVKPYRDGYRHISCEVVRPEPKPKPEPRREPTVTVSCNGRDFPVTARSKCLICKKPLSGAVQRHKKGYRHEDCPVPPAYTLDRQGRPVYRKGGHRRADGVWVCPPRSAALETSRVLTEVTVRPRNRPWVPRHPMLDEGQEYREDHGSSSANLPDSYWFEWYRG